MVLTEVLVKKTCKDVSVVDYLVLSSKLFPLVSKFSIDDFEPLFSDCHCLFHFSFNALSVSHIPEATIDRGDQPVKWNSTKQLDFVNCISNDREGVLAEIDQRLDY